MKTKTKRDIQFAGAALLLVVGLTYFLSSSDSQNDLQVDETVLDTNNLSEQNDGVAPNTPALESDVEIGTDGVVIEIDRSGIENDEPAIITIQTDANSVYKIAVPTENLSNCEAVEEIAEVGLIAIGDKISIRGKTDGEGRIVPCDSEFHQMKVRGVYENNEIGLSFNYKKSPEGYMLETENKEFSTSEDFVTGALLVNKKDAEALLSSSVPGEFPPTTMVRVYNNPNELSPDEWASANPDETGYNRALAEPAEISVGRKEAIGYTVDGLYLTDVYVTTYNEYALVVTGEYIEYESEPFNDIEQLVATIVFEE